MCFSVDALGYLSRRDLLAVALASRNQSLTASEPFLSASALRIGSALSFMTPWPFCIRNTAKAVGAYAKFENPHQFRARPYPWRCPHYGAMLQDTHQTSTRDPRLGGYERRSRQDVEVRLASLARWSGLSPFRLRDIWYLGQIFPRLLRNDDEEGGGSTAVSQERPSVCTGAGGSR